MAAKKIDRQKFLSRIFALIVLAFATASLFLTGLDLSIKTPGAPPIPDPPVLVAYIFIVIGLGLELWKPKTEWKLQKKMLPLLVISVFFAVWTIFTFNILVGRYPGGPENPFDSFFFKVVPPGYTVFTGTFFFGFFYPIYLTFRPSANAIAGGVLYFLICITAEGIARALELLPPEWGIYLEDFILNFTGLAMFGYWYKTTPKEERKFLGVDLLWFAIAVTVIVDVVLLAMVFTGVLKL